MVVAAYPIPAVMKGPAEKRWDGHHHGVVIQIKITTYCDLDCRCCTAAVGLLKKHRAQWHMTPDQFRVAVRSLSGFPGMIGVFGGNPCVSPHFEEICAIFREEVPDKTRRGLWSNRLFGHGAICRETFHGPHSNINVHRNRAAFEEIRRDWPKARPFGHLRPSIHGSWWTAIQDLIPDEAERWELIGKCYVNQTWSAEITLIGGELRGFFCEFAATQAEFEALRGNPDLGLRVEPGWWNHGIEHYAEQVRKYCHQCGAPLNPSKVIDLSDAPEDYTRTHEPVFLTIKGRPSRLIKSLDDVKTDTPATYYVPG
jgi:hypothetical protein